MVAAGLQHALIAVAEGGVADQRHVLKTREAEQAGGGGDLRSDQQAREIGRRRPGRLAGADHTRAGPEQPRAQGAPVAGGDRPFVEGLDILVRSRGAQDAVLGQHGIELAGHKGDEPIDAAVLEQDPLGVRAWMAEQPPASGRLGIEVQPAEDLRLLAAHDVGAAEARALDARHDHHRLGMVCHP